MLLCGAAAALPNQALAVSFSTSSGYTFSGTGAIQATGQGVQQISTSFDKSVSLGSVSKQCDPTNITGTCGADASASTSGAGE